MNERLSLKCQKFHCKKEKLSVNLTKFISTNQTLKANCDYMKEESKNEVIELVHNNIEMLVQMKWLEVVFVNCAFVYMLILYCVYG